MLFSLMELVEFLGTAPGGSEPWMSLEEPIQMGLVGVCEMIRSAYQREADPTQRPVFGDPV